MRPAGFRVLIPLPSIVLVAALAVSAIGSSEPRLTWIGPDGNPTWVRGLGTAESGSPLLAPRWFPALPDLDIRLLDGGTFPVGAARGKVVLLDFWASWCAPCRVELPHLQRLQDQEATRGLASVAVNAHEPREVAAKTAATLGLRLPIGLYDDAVDEALGVRSLPTVVLVDRAGRIRYRWDGYSPGLEGDIAERTRQLLGEDLDGAPAVVGEVLHGAGALEVRWWRELPAPIGGVAVLPSPEGGVRLAVHANGQLWALEPDGTVLGKPQAPALSGRLLPADLDGDASPELIGYRQGGRAVTVFDVKRGTFETWDAPAAVFDATVLAAESPSRPEGRIVLATLEGLFLADPGGLAHRIGEPAEMVGVAIRSGERSTAVLALDSKGALRRYLVSGPMLDAEPAAASPRLPEGSWVLISSPQGAGFGVAPVDVNDAVIGRLFEGTGRQVAMGVGGDRLVVLDLAAGTPRWEARIPGTSNVIAADLDGDGRDELVVSAGASLFVLGARRTAD